MKRQTLQKGVIQSQPRTKLSIITSTLLLTTTLALSSPSGGVVKSGTASIVHTTNTTNINQSTNSASINWDRFNIAKNETVNFNQPSSSSITLNKVIGTEKSIINGALNANGQVWILNSNGVLFGKTASINTSGLLATTKTTISKEVTSGDYIILGTSNHSVINDGSINIKSNGYVVLAANEVQNNGVIKAIKGKVHLVGADAIDINLNGNSLISLNIKKSVLNSLVKNSGKIYADGGEIYLSTNAKDSLLKSVVNNTGLIEANSMDGLNGKVQLFAHGGTAEVGGVINAKDGFVETSGEKFTALSDIDINAGEWLIDPNGVNIDGTLATAIMGALNGSGGTDVTITATASSGSGSGVDVPVDNTTADADGDIDVESDIIWNSTHTLTLDASNNINVKATIEDQDKTDGGVLFKVGTGDVLFPKDSGVYSGKVVINSLNQLQTLDDLMGGQWDADIKDLINQKGLSGNYELGSDIDASDTKNWNDERGWKPIGNYYSLGYNNFDNEFTGKFNGKDSSGTNHTISGLTINRPDEDNVGLIGTMDGATIDNIGLVGGSVKGDSDVGGLVGYSESSSTITNSYATGDVTGTGTGNYVGGLVGFNDNSTITNSYATGDVTGTGDYVGGLIGESFDSTITNSYATGDVTGSGDDVGGLVGYSENSSTIINSYAIGTVVGNSNVGGLVGLSETALVVTNSFYNSTVNASSDYGTGATEDELKKIDTFNADTDSPWSISYTDDTTIPNLDSSYRYPILVKSGSDFVWRIYNGPDPIPTTTTSTEEVGNIASSISNDTATQVVIPDANTFTSGASLTGAVSIQSDTGNNLNIITASPSSNQSTKTVTLDQRRTSGGGTTKDIRTPISSDSTITLVNAGISLPAGVEQEFYIAPKQADEKTKNDKE